MTWLKGTTTLSALAPKLTQLICGEIADDIGNTCASGDKWVRLNGGQDTISSPPSNDYTAMPTWRMRTGYFSLCSSDGNGNQTGRLGAASICKVTNPFTSNPASAHGRYVVYVVVKTANTVANNYSTAAVNWAIYDVDGASVITGAGTINPSSGGLVTIANGLTITLSDPTGFLAVGTTWQRGFTNTYTYGIDTWPMWGRRGSSCTIPTFGTAPPGVASTDYDIIEQVAVVNSWSNNVGGTFVGASEINGLFSGLAIKSSTGFGGGGVLYTGTFPIAAMKMRIWNSGTLGTLGLDAGPSILDTVNGSVFRVSYSPQYTVWANCIKTPGSASSSTPVQYFISVKPDGIYLILNADPAGTGKVGTAYAGLFTPYDTTYDVLPQMVNQQGIDFTTDNSSQGNGMYTPLPYWRIKRLLNSDIGITSGTASGSTSTTLTDSTQTRTVNGDVGYTLFAGSSYGVVTANTATGWTVSSWTGGTPSSTAKYYVARDWQTGFQRSDFQIQTFGATSSNYGYSLLRNFLPVSYYNSTSTPGLFPTSQNKPNYDGNWWLYGLQYTEGSYSNNISPNENDFTRGYQATRYFCVPDTGWGHGDELTDSNTGEKFLLIKADYAGAAHRIKYASNTYAGGVAVAEL